MIPFRGFLNAKEYNNLAPLRYGQKLIPCYGDSFGPSIVNYAKLDEFKQTHTSKDNDVILSSYLKCGNHLLNKICIEIMIQLGMSKHMHPISSNIHWLALLWPKVRCLQSKIIKQI